MDVNLAGTKPGRSGPDPAELLARYMALRDVSRLVAAFAGYGEPESEQPSTPEHIASALENANIWALRQFGRQCIGIGNFMMLGLSALQKARVRGAFNPHAARRLYQEYKSSEANALRGIGI